MAIKPLRIGFMGMWASFNTSDYNRIPILNYIIKKGIPYVICPWNREMDILIYSVFDIIQTYKRMNKINTKLKILINGENSVRFFDTRILRFYWQYIQRRADIIIGFTDNQRDPGKYIKFPFYLWLYDQVCEWDTENNFVKYIMDENAKNKLATKDYLGTCISKYDVQGYRRNIINRLSSYGEVRCPGRVGNNCHPIGKSYSEKISFIRHGKFNICPENSAGDGYVTEKIFHALEAGTIPIYSGGMRPEIVNPASYIYIPNIGDLGNMGYLCDLASISACIDSTIINDFDKYSNCPILVEMSEYIVADMYLQMELWVYTRIMSNCILPRYATTVISNLYNIIKVENLSQPQNRDKSNCRESIIETFNALSLGSKLVLSFDSLNSFPEMQLNIWHGCFYIPSGNLSNIVSVSLDTFTTTPDNVVELISLQIQNKICLLIKNHFTRRYFADILSAYLG